MKGYKTSDDYEVLWDLLQKGYKVIGIIGEGNDDWIYSITKQGNIIYLYAMNELSGIRMNPDKVGFINDCWEMGLRYIMPEPLKWGIITKSVPESSWLYPWIGHEVEFNSMEIILQGHSYPNNEPNYYITDQIIIK